MRYLLRNIQHWKIKNDTLKFGILTLIVVLFWIGFELYRAYTSSTISPEIEELLTPLNPSLDIETIDNLSDRFIPPEDFIPSTKTVGSSENSPATPSGLIIDQTPTNDATQSAN